MRFFSFFNVLALELNSVVTRVLLQVCAAKGIQATVIMHAKKQNTWKTGEIFNNLADNFTVCLFESSQTHTISNLQEL